MGGVHGRDAHAPPDRRRYMKLFSQACENNREPILAVLVDLLSGCTRVLEVGSGTGQHAAWFSARMPHLRWQASDLAASLPGIAAWLDDAGAAARAPAPLVLDVDAGRWPDGPWDAVFSANTAHIMHWPSVCNMLRGVGKALAPGGAFILYGPFRFDDRPLAESNVRFDRDLRARDPGMGVRAVSDLEREAQRNGMALAGTHTMPANNHLLVWRRA
jgi:SAM-dependent methyltransferase